LTSQEASELRRKYGLNKLPEKKPRSPLSILAAQFKNPLIYIITIAAIISVILAQFEDAIIIIVVIAIDSIVGFFQEYRAEKTMSALRNLLKPMARVIRNGDPVELETIEIMPGDLVMVGPGDKIAADGSFLETVNLGINEAILTGESEPILKKIDDPAFMATTVLAGRGLLQVTATGLNTQLGKIAASISEIKEKATPLQTRLEKFGKTLTYIVICISLAIFLTGTLMRYGILDMIELAIVLAIAAIPEGLIIAVTMILAIGMKAILKRKGLVKKLLAVETLGSVSTICTDKTGTLTEGIMRVVRTDFRSEEYAFYAMVLCNNVENSLEISLLDHVKSKLVDPQIMIEKCPRIHEVPFSSETKYMLTVNTIDGVEVGLIKGAPDIVMNFCSLSPEEKGVLVKQLEDWAGAGLKMLGVAYKKGNNPKELANYTWNGFIGIEDPIRVSVKDAISLCRKAGIKIKMITGDYRKTAEKVAMNLGLATGPEQVIEGKDLDAMSEGELAKIVKSLVIFCRVTPQHKMKIVTALQAAGEITAMIGDGVNDAPALKKADIGVSVGNATDVAQETASLILLDNNFNTLVNSVEEGRIIFDNIRKVVAYVLSNSFAEIFIIFGAFILGWQAPLTIAQILWIHLICDGPSDICLGFERSEKGIMEEPPKSLDESILTVKSKFLIIAISCSSALICLILFNTLRSTDLVLSRTIVFSILAVQGLIYIFSYRSLSYSVFKSGRITSNKWLLGSVISGLLLVVVALYLPGLNSVLEVIPLDLFGWAVVLSISFLMLFIVEICKFAEKKIRGTPITRVSKILQDVRKKMPEINNLHNISVDILKDKTLIQFHFGIPAETPLESAHDLATMFEAKIEEEFPTAMRRNLEIFSHLEPATITTPKMHSHTQRPTPPQIQAEIAEAVKSVPGLKRWNHLNVIDEDNNISVSLIAYFDGSMNIGDAHHLTEDIEAEIRKRIPSLKRCFVHSEPA